MDEEFVAKMYETVFSKQQEKNRRASMDRLEAAMRHAFSLRDRGHKMVAQAEVIIGWIQKIRDAECEALAAERQAEGWVNEQFA